MKDVQGIQRGKCNDPGCECEEYIAHKGSGSLRCEYCNHTPAQHVKIIALGACSSCGKDNCASYESEDPNKYTDCEYCGCKAECHAGAEKLRKPPKVPDVSASLPHGSMGQPMLASVGGGFQVRLDAYGKPVQTLDHGSCKCPGCPFPKRVEAGRVLDYCSRTCSKKHADMLIQRPGGHIQPRPPPSSGGKLVLTEEKFTVYGPSGSGPPMVATSMTASMTKPPPPPPSSAPLVTAHYPPSSSAPQVPKPCKQCGVRAANPGKSWCQQCFNDSQYI